MDTNAFFDTPEDIKTTEVAVESKPKAKKDDNGMNKVLVDTFQKKVAEMPNIVSMLKTRSGDLEVTKVLSSGTLKNLILDKANPKKADGKRNVIPVTGICGYRLKNIGTEPIVYKTAEYKADENGIYVGTEVEKSAAPGQEFELNRKYFTILTSEPQFSFTLANGKVHMGKGLEKCVTLDEQLEKPYFQYFAVDGELTVSVHDDSVKELIEDSNGVVKKKYEKTFGYLYNPTTKSSSGGGGNKISTQELAANYFQSLLAGGAAN